MKIKEMKIGKKRYYGISTGVLFRQRRKFPKYKRANQIVK